MTTPRPAQPRSAAGAASAAGDQAHRPAEPAEARGQKQAGNGPVIVMSYPHSGAQQIQDILAADRGLACTVGTGIIPQCAAAAEAWQQVESRDDPFMSRLAVSTLRALVTAQLTVILTSTGQARWCELSTAAPQDLQPFLQVFPHTAVLCVHRCCPDVITAMVNANPWGLRNAALTPYLLAYPGNNVAATAAYWANATEELLTFEKTHLGNARRTRLEDMIVPGASLAAVRDWLNLSDPPPGLPPMSPVTQQQSGTYPPQPPAEIPADMIPPPLHQRINRLHTELGYRPLESRDLSR